LAATATFPEEPSRHFRGLSTRLHAPHNVPVISSARHPTRQRILPVLCPDMPPRRCPLPTESPFARSRRYRFRPVFSTPVGGRYPAFIALTGSCARPSSSCRLRSSLFLRVFAGCCEPLLHDGPSRRYLCDPCTVTWVRTPPRFSGALIRFFPLNIGLSFVLRRSARETILQHSFTQGEISGRQPFSHDQASVLAWPPDCSDQTDFRPFSLVAVYTGQYLHRYRPQAPASLRVRIRTIDTTGLAGAHAHAHLLDRSLVGCSDPSMLFSRTVPGRPSIQSPANLLHKARCA
jgi:hypothetical protein